ncbi:hypothetical protein [Algoriphagus zhangzhouensis]|uniref:hypothetical protein n=1 Tax=Algoriphagus zhangzhouensis TaxID=1073327 RepID=UPI001416F1F0|nr:hypothetical protein [Algoriphagus zhangzhouensis]
MDNSKIDFESKISDKEKFSSGRKSDEENAILFYFLIYNKVLVIETKANNFLQNMRQMLDKKGII